jgi:hypothetical protein
MRAPKMFPQQNDPGAYPRNASAALLVIALYCAPLAAGLPSVESQEFVAVPANADSDNSREPQMSVNLCTDLQSGWRLNSGESLFSALGGFRLTMQDDGNLVLYAIDDMKLPSDFLHVYSYAPDVLKLYAKPIWSTGTHVPKAGKGRGSYCAMEEDGNLVVYDQAQHPCFETRTGGHRGSYLRLQTDGNLVVYTRDLKVAWASNTAARPSRGPEPGRPPDLRRQGNQRPPAFPARLSKDLRSGIRLNLGDSLFSPLGGFRLVLQDDGNLVLYVIDDMQIPWDSSLVVYHDLSILGVYHDVIWSSGTHVRDGDAGPGAYGLMKADGNFIIYDDDDKPCFQSGTKGNPGAFLRCQDDGNLVIYTRDNKAIWQSKTYARIDDVPVAK